MTPSSPYFTGHRKKPSLRLEEKATPPSREGETGGCLLPLSLSPPRPALQTNPNSLTSQQLLPVCPARTWHKPPSLLCSPGILPAPTSTGIPGAPVCLNRTRREGDASAFDCWWICSIIRMPSPRFWKERIFSLLPPGPSKRPCTSSAAHKCAFDPARCCWLSSPTELSAHQKRGPGWEKNLTDACKGLRVSSGSEWCRR